MPNYDYRCQECNELFTAFWAIEDRNIPTHCPNCGKTAKRLVTVSEVDCSSECPKWIRSCTEVMDQDDNHPASIEFRKDPTRENLEKWKKAKGLRNLEPGETKHNRTRRAEEQKESESRLTEETLKGFQKDTALEVK